MIIDKKKTLTVKDCIFIFTLAVLMLPIFLWQVLYPNNDHKASINTAQKDKNVTVNNHVQNIVNNANHRTQLDNDADIFYPEQTSSLAGTQIDGGLTTNTQGHFVPDKHALQLFDYFFLATGEVPDDSIEATIKQFISLRLTGQAKEDALVFLNQYITYRQAAKELYLTAGDKDELIERYQLIKSLRSAVFGEQLSTQLFAEQEKIASLTMERLAIYADNILTAQEKSERANQIIAELPEAERSTYKRSLTPRTLRNTVEQLRQEQADTTQIWLAREHVYGSEAADRLARLDESKQQWQNKVNQYRIQRDKILHSTTADPDEQHQQLSELQSQWFSPSELKRIRVLDSIADNINES